VEQVPAQLPPPKRRCKGHPSPRVPFFLGASPNMTFRHDWSRSAGRLRNFDRLAQTMHEPRALHLKLDELLAQRQGREKQLINLEAFTVRRWKSCTKWFERIASRLSKGGARRRGVRSEDRASRGTGTPR
jgi:hypothetical protein